MSRRCQPGQRAKVIGEGGNKGAVVLVVGPHFPGEEWGGPGLWVAGLFPWKTLSLGGPLGIQDADTLAPLPPSMYCVFEDEDLEPLKDDDDGLTHSTGRDRPARDPACGVLEESPVYGLLLEDGGC
jgi:hypothetical protein